uniref:Uncharacterized protein n=1 Tax=Arundo donax TaxID=35708 RepID=A0A0A9B3H2_ARUDO
MNINKPRGQSHHSNNYYSAQMQELHQFSFKQIS